MKKLLPKKIPAYLLAIIMVTAVACGGSTEKESDSDQKETTVQTDTASTPETKLNINTADEKAFRTIPNVGDKMVHEFEEYRPYVSIQQFRKEIGKYVDENRVAAYEKYIYVPIHRNDSDVATVMQITGLDESEADELVSGRPYKTNQAFLDALSSYVSEEALTKAERYLKSE
ncbi:hypothetical protein CK503_04280 [Aliifodinibius salipaludis]|uniref:Uncharacterized protein n=1 Tax=Fodinibius salipaludis TaxID=2032627 RepID=A0A2A2GCT8_9BACT|nr:hypothetical protein [Aliifodinibius salipaludis]PAU94697.1 hypothetical protein CK503_04280 [Aliifodinibius salipaludis]